MTDSFDVWLKDNRKQLEQDFIDAYEDMFIEYCNTIYEGD